MMKYLCSGYYVGVSAIDGGTYGLFDPYGYGISTETTAKPAAGSG